MTYTEHKLYQKIDELQQQIQNYRTTVQSQQQLIVELKEEIGSSYWFDKTIGVS
jgi:peptidoglycan hydrolase CwlO-like protein